MDPYAVYTNTLLAPFTKPSSQSVPESISPTTPARGAVTTIDRTINSVQSNDYTSHIPTEHATPQKTLTAHLSSDTIVSQSTINVPSLTEIGRGTYGIIFQNPETLEVIKRPINHRAPRNNLDLWNDFKMHILIHESFQSLSYSKIHIPKPLQFISAADSEWWSLWSHKFPDDYQNASKLLFSERVISVPHAVRDALVDLFCPEQYRFAAKTSTKNQVCLIHPLLGRRKGSYRLRGMMNLRNFELCVDQMEAFGLDVGCLIDSMAEALAVMHFRARVDAHDVEFVFGSAPSRLHHNTVSFEDVENLPRDTTVRPSGSWFDFHGRVLHLWIIDFNRVSQIPTAEEFVSMALKGFVDQSKAYYPRPRFADDDGEDDRNWRWFKDAYLRGVGIVGGDVDMAARFLQAVEEHYREDKARRERKPSVALESELGGDESLDVLGGSCVLC